MELTGRTVVVTGGASGIGRASALLLAHTDARVLTSAVDQAGGRPASDATLFCRQPERIKAALTRVIPFCRISQPVEIAQAVLFFASDRANYVTGQVLRVSGGLTMAG